jgi:hypothetical protein
MMRISGPLDSEQSPIPRRYLSAYERLSACCHFQEDEGVSQYNTMRKSALHACVCVRADDGLCLSRTGVNCWNTQMSIDMCARGRTGQEKTTAMPLM